MGKSTKKKPAMAAPSAPGELIVVVSSDAGIRSLGDSVASATGTSVSSLNAVLDQYGASMYPIFGSENRVNQLSAPTLDAMTAANVDMATFYKVDTAAKLEDVAAALLNEGLVTAAYVKPPAEPPVLNDVMTTPPDGQETPRATPNFTARQRYLDAAPGGIDARYAWTLSGGKGNGTRIIDIEGAWRFTHEDLTGNQGGVIGGALDQHGLD